MYSLIRNPGFRRHLIPEIGSMATSIIIAELFFKFHSFTLECLGFLATWYAISNLVYWVQRSSFLEKEVER